MQIEKTAYGPWAEAFKCTQGGVELTAVASVGPRIISLKTAKGPNFLFENLNGSMGVGEWRIRGGHRLWVSPETNASYTPDNAPVKAEIQGDVLRLAAPAEPSGLQKTLEIAPCPESGGFLIRHLLRNEGPMLNFGAIWALTCVVPTGQLIMPWGEGTPDAGDTMGWRTQMIRYWRRWAGTDAHPQSSQWVVRDDHFLVQPTGETGKVGLYGELGILAQLRPEGTFIKRAKSREGVTYPDGGCNIEIYTSGSFMEMETLSPLLTLHPGQTLTHEESWLLTDEVIAPADWTRLLALTTR